MLNVSLPFPPVTLTHLAITNPRYFLFSIDLLYFLVILSVVFIYADVNPSYPTSMLITWIIVRTQMVTTDEFCQLRVLHLW